MPGFLAPLAISAGSSLLGGLFSGLSGRRRNRQLQDQLSNYQRPNYDQGVTQQLQDAYSNFDNRTDQGFDYYRQLASSGTPGLSSLIGASNARGGTGGLASLQLQALGNRNLQQAYQGFGNYQLGREGQKQGLLGLIDQRDRGIAGLDLQARNINQQGVFGAQGFADQARQNSPLGSFFSGLAGSALNIGSEQLYNRYVPDVNYRQITPFTELPKFGPGGNANFGVGVNAGFGGQQNNGFQ